MSDTGDIKRAIKQLAKGEDLLPSVVCTVDSVDLVNKTCYCIPVTGEADLLDVAIFADPDKKGFMAVPKVGSTVYVKFKGKHSAFVAMTSEIDLLHLNGDNFGGIVKVDNLITSLNNLEGFANKVIAAVIAINAAAASAPAVPVTNATLAAFLATITPPTPLVLSTSAIMQNTTVKHGTGI